MSRPQRRSTPHVGESAASGKLPDHALETPDCPGASGGLPEPAILGESGEPGESGERGAGTVLALGLALLVVLAAVLLAMLAQSAAMASRAAAAADLAALAAADAARGIAPGEPCAVAVEVAHRNGARVLSCAAGAGFTVQVRTELDVRTPVGAATGLARAGPPP
ncbi:secretion/DNA translocation related TadE-like protein [Pseudarthrobacter oxydans]|uniref:Rv3654c family TadE-like protein n=1 Tax=Pseudarthrobacter oxydans TaxID=1671 RepID=UPI00277F32CD|nr:Rv3654c family TadE-like protein [Pseudarthrobacter oxydans]MDP9982489.1 secretion/DNA translocation related TadE-like protein [Pseudarthrobacter oxydans]